MNKTTKKAACIILALILSILGCFAVQAQTTEKREPEIVAPRYSTINTNSCAIGISGINATMTASLYSKVSTSLKIVMELQKVKSGVYKTIETYTETGSGLHISLTETRLMNAFATYRLKVTFTAGSETVVSYAYP